MKIAITGANGFVGAALCRYFYKKGHEIQAIGNRERPNQNLLNIAKYIQADITELMEPINADVCIHAAALSSDTDTYKNLILSNVEGTLNVVEAAKNCGFFIHISSSSVYQFKNHPIKEEEASINADLSNYGETKLLAEDIVELEIPDHQKRLILRPRAIYGIGDRILLPRLLRLIKGKYLLCPFKKGTQSSLTHVDNLGYAIELYLDQKEKTPFQIFNITDEQPYFLRELALEFSSAVEKRQLLPISLPSSLMKILLLLNSKNNQASYISKPVLRSMSNNSVLDISKIKRELKYSPSKNFHNSCADIVHWVDNFGSAKSYMRQLSDAPWSITS
ncbi:NAD-dependent epimerase/dehydratase family protein [Daejeonella lutea]|uniref:Nucleoside-diphosphate-sugar epimerase n=1 Tax=Daejeonella lutea TaxID=572036 RepID=A0A1T4ZZ65_9SPHI|nr:NAD(P)-dependent oxidoreductase [Daejeonella lutea]SKB27673.1 Nucleoside-diphosphate-sugar epimerase [Daejeonella lutea]